MPGHPFYGTEEWKRTRRVVLIRDNFTCQLCGVYLFGAKHKLRVDHIIERRERPDLALVLSNLRTICTDCDGIRHRGLRGGRTTVGCNAAGVPLEAGHHWNTRRRSALLLLPLLAACATPRTAVSVCPAAPQPNAVAVVCTQQPSCRRNCYLTVTAAQATGSGDQTVTSSDAPTVTETTSRSKSIGPLP